MTNTPQNIVTEDKNGLKQRVCSFFIFTFFGSRREFDRQMKTRLGEKVEIVEWFEAIGLEVEPGLREIR
jgi:hypothetical protein